MKRYVVLIATDPARWEEADEATRQEYFDAHHSFERYVDEHGTRHHSGALCDAELATTVRHTDDGPVVSDGPFVELAEQLSGYYDVDLPDLDSAIAAAKLLPRAYSVEIRPITVIEGYESV